MSKRPAGSVASSHERLKPTDHTELYHIVHRKNLQSIFEHGLLSHEAAQQYRPLNIARERPQTIRREREIHDYACLYFNAQNAMLFDVILRAEIKGYSWDDICVLVVSPEVLDLEEVRVSDGGLGSQETSDPLPMPTGVKRLRRTKVFALGWNQDEAQQEENKRLAMAEVLIPNEIAPEYIEAVYTFSYRAYAVLKPLFPKLELFVREDWLALGTTSIAKQMDGDAT
ncbi:DarT ssDNA thymidine ADP-ribosyltransferase family protein [Candidatus Poriferisodalis sp.]|uniref:DarT ssDNA thymidine ADP-ribosyltransferase family protein n=1 Tax=Candidatus Poriferisodalis sp. TaxID=3101277 RepID=UPI003B01D37F